VFRPLLVLCLLALPALGDPTALSTAPTVPGGSSGTPSLSINFSSSGLTSVNWNGTEMLASGTPNLEYVGMIQPDGSWVGASMTCTTTANIPNQTLTQTYPWGTMTYVYTTTPTQLFCSVTIQNTSSTPMGMFMMQLLEIQFPQTPAEYDGVDPMMAWNMGSPSIIHTTFGTGSMALTNEDVVNPLMIGWPWSLDSNKTIFPLLILTGGDGSLPTSYPFINRQIPAGGTLTYKVGFRFGGPTATNFQLAGDLYQAFAAAYPNTLQWTDHRPIAQLMLTSVNGYSPTNPRCWFGDTSVDVTTPAGIAAFQQRVLAYAKQAVANCQAEGAQGAVTWDIEGQQFPQPTTYIGDPRLISTLAPEMAGVVDAYFKTFTDAGLKVGTTIRPQQLVLTNSNTQASQVDVADPGQLMLQKISYANTRWGATLFYVDSNGQPDNPTPINFFHEVTSALPNVLLMPEQSNMSYYSITAPYGQLNLGVTGTPPDVIWAYPKAFRVYTISDGDVTDNMAALVSSVARGDVLYFRGWYNSPESPQVQQIYQQAGQAAGGAAAGPSQ